MNQMILHENFFYSENFHFRTTTQIVFSYCIHYQIAIRSKLSCFVCSFDSIAEKHPSRIKVNHHRHTSKQEQFLNLSFFLTGEDATEFEADDETLCANTSRNARFVKLSMSA